MDKNTIIQTIGGVAKEENLFTLTTHIMPNTFVLENEVPYPGYHGINLPTDSKPISVFLITKKKYSTEKILRITHNIKKYFEHPFDAVPGVICIQNDTLSCIRIKDLDNYDLVEDLQKCFFSEGIQLMKKKNISAPGVIQLKKQFNIVPVEDGIYKDLDDKSMFYISISKQLSWQLFVQITGKIRNNIDKEMANFDAALAAIYTRNILDVVRIYAREMDIEWLKEIQNRYLEEISKRD
jgi:hypothetical protein